MVFRGFRDAIAESIMRATSCDSLCARIRVDESECLGFSSWFVFSVALLFYDEGHGV